MFPMYLRCPFSHGDRDLRGCGYGKGLVDPEMISSGCRKRDLFSLFIPHEFRLDERLEKLIETRDGKEIGREVV